LVTLFSNGASVGLVKLYARPAVAELRALFAGIQDRGDTRPSNEQSFVLNDPKDWFGSPAGSSTP